jgi:hypothetical protein
MLEHTSKASGILLSHTSKAAGILLEHTSHLPKFTWHGLV